MEYTIEDTFDISAPAYWEMFFSDEYNAGLWPALDIDWELLRFERSGEGESLVIEREARLTPRRDVPRMLRSIIDGTISYVEKNYFSAADNRMKTVIQPSFMADRIDNHGIYRLEPLGDDRVKRIWDGHTTARVPMLGGRVESFLVDQVKESYRKTTEFTRKWIAEHR